MSPFAEMLEQCVARDYMLAGTIKGTKAHFIVDVDDLGNFKVDLHSLIPGKFFRKIPAKYLVGLEEEEEVEALIREWVESRLMIRQIAFGTMYSFDVADFWYTEVDRTLKFDLSRVRPWSYQIDTDEFVEFAERLQKVDRHWISEDENGLGNALAWHCLSIPHMPSRFLSACLWAVCDDLGKPYHESMKSDPMLCYAHSHQASGSKGVSGDNE